LSYRSLTQTLTGLVGVEPDDLSVDSAAATPLAHSPGSNAPGRIRTCDLTVIDRALLPAELQAQNWDARIRTSIDSFKDYRPAS
jgi:hypothetical protein